MNLKGLIWLVFGLFLSVPASAGEREQTAWQMVEDGALVVDVRTSQEFAGGHLDDALLIPYQGIVAEFARRDIPKDQPVMLYCRSGNRAGIAEAALQRAGYTRVFNGGGYVPLMREAR